MNPFFQQFIIETVRTYYKKHPEKNPEARKVERVARNVQVELTHELWDMFYLTLGVFAAAFGLKAFLIPSSFIDGGVMGISLIIHEAFDIQLAPLVLILNLPFIGLAFTAINTRFAIKSVIGIVMLSLVLYFIPFPVITTDKILVAAFGGVFLGLGIGLAIRGGAIIDGTEVLAIFISRKTSLTVGNVILIFNLIIFLVGAYVLSTEIALYAILTYFAASKTVDFVIDGIEEYMSVTIISDYSDEIRKSIIDNMGRGCTIFNGQRGFTKNGAVLRDTQIVYTIITRLEMSRLKTEIDKIDPEAFIVMASVKDTKGGMIKKKPIKKIK